MDRSNWIHVEASHVVDARPEEVHAVIADFRVAHPAILPKQFTALIVEEGGFGAGTLLRGSVKMFGQEYPFLTWHAAHLAHQHVSRLALLIHCSLAACLGMLAITWVEQRLERGSRYL